MESQKKKANNRGFTVFPIMIIIMVAIFSVTLGASAIETIIEEQQSSSEDDEEHSLDEIIDIASFTPKMMRSSQEAFRETYSVILVVDNTPTLLITKKSTVGDLLDEQNIVLSPELISRPTPDTEITSGLCITLLNVTKGTVKTEEPIPFKTVQNGSKYISKGKEKVITEGEEGILETLIEITYENGREVSSEELSSTVVKEPVDRVIEYGTGGTITTPDGQVLSYSKKLDVKATAYTTEGYKNKITATGTVARVGAIAVDPKVIPLGSMVYITSRNGTSWVYGIATCEDTGGYIKGNIVDLFFDTRNECFQFGRQNATVYILAG